MDFARNNLLFYASLPEGYSFAEKIQAAVETGFTEVSLWVPAVEEAVSELGSLESLREFLDHQGMQVSVLEMLSSWPGETDVAKEEAETLAAMASALGTEIVLAGCLSDTIEDRPNAVSNLRQQCRILEAIDCKVAFEFLPWAAIPDIRSAETLLDQVGAENLGLVLDTWHFARSGMDYEYLEERLKAPILCVQASCALDQPDGDMSLIEETMHHRLPAGEGCLDWRRLNHLLQQKCPDTPIGAEIFSSELREMSLQQALAVLYQSVPGRIGH